MKSCQVDRQIKYNITQKRRLLDLKTFIKPYIKNVITKSMVLKKKLILCTFKKKLIHCLFKKALYKVI